MLGLQLLFLTWRHPRYFAGNCGFPQASPGRGSQENKIIKKAKKEIVLAFLVGGGSPEASGEPAIFDDF